MFFLRAFSLGFAGILALWAMGCGDDGPVGPGTGGSGAAASGGSGGAGGATTGSGATGGSGGSGGTGGTGGMFAGMTLTSPDITEGAAFPAAYTCAGANGSPALAWTAGPAGTMSYVVIFKDQTNGLIHSAIWDIPAELTGLPAGVEKTKNPANVPGAKQATSYDGQTYGYLGPCPNGNLHTYTFTVYAVNVATLPLVGLPSKESAADLAVEHELADASLSGTSDAKP